MSDTQTMEGIKRNAPEGATHYHVGLQFYLQRGTPGYHGGWYRCGSSPSGKLGLKGVMNGATDEWVIQRIADGEIIVLSDIPDDMAESMPFGLLQGDDEKPRSKYHREIKPGVWVDCYDVLKAFDVRCPAIQHMIKKCLAPGQRGHKDLQQDMQDIVASAKRAQELAQ